MQEKIPVTSIFVKSVEKAIFFVPLYFWKKQNMYLLSFLTFSGKMQVSVKFKKLSKHENSQGQNSSWKIKL